MIFLLSHIIKYIFIEHDLRVSPGEGLWGLGPSGLPKGAQIELGALK